MHLLRRLSNFVFPPDALRGHAAEVVVWPAASNDRRLVAVCSGCRKILRSGFTAEAVRGPYDHKCEPVDSRRSAL